MLIPTGLVILTIAAQPWGAVVGFAISGLGMTTALTGLSAHLQERVPDGLRGRVMAVWSVGFLGSRRPPRCCCLVAGCVPATSSPWTPTAS